MEIPVSSIVFNFTNSSSCPPEIGQTSASVPLWRQTYEVGVCVVATTANLVVIACLWRDPSSEVSGFSTYAVSVAFTDLLVGLVLMPVKFIQTIWPTWSSGLPTCIIWKIYDNGLISVSMLLYLAMGYDRYRCVTAPLQYRSQFRKSRILRISVSVWILGFLLWIPYIMLKVLIYNAETFRTSCPLFILGNNIFELIHITLAYYVPLLALIIMNSILLKRLNDRIHGFGRQKPIANSPQKPANISTVSSGPGNHSRPRIHVPVTSMPAMGVNRGHVSQKKRSKLASSYKIVILIVVFCVFWLPFYITWPLNGLCPSCISDKIRAVFGLFTYGQSAVNPLIVISTSRHIRSKIARACGVLRHRK